MDSTFQFELILLKTGAKYWFFSRDTSEVSEWVNYMQLFEVKNY